MSSRCQSAAQYPRCGSELKLLSVCCKSHPKKPFSRSIWSDLHVLLMQELVRRGVDSHDIDVAMREAFGPDTQKLHIHSDNAVDDGDAEAAGRFSEPTCLVLVEVFLLSSDVV